MAWWKKALGIGMVVGGAMSGNPALVAGGAGVFSSSMAEDAQKKAEQQQLEASDKALKLQQDTQANTQASLQPYSATGGAAVQTLGHMLGLTPSGGSAGAAPPGATPAPGGPLDPAASMARTDTGRLALPRGEGTLASATEQTRSGYGGASIGDMATGGAVQMRAPTGDVEWIRADLVPQFEQAGATVIGGVA